MVDARGPVLVAVGPDGSSAAVSFGADEAVRRARSLHLVHGVGAAVDEQTSRRREEDAEWLLRVMEHLAQRQVAGAVPVTSESVVAGPAEALRRTSEGASLVVVGRRSRRSRGHPQLRSATETIAARVSAPVASVPGGWPRRRSHPLVVVGVDPHDVSVEALAEGFRAADRQRARLALIAAPWGPPGIAPPASLDRVDELAEVMNAWYEEVAVDVVALPSDAAQVLVAASRHAQLLVLARSDPRQADGMRIGPVARTVLREAACPILLSSVESGSS